MEKIDVISFRKKITPLQNIFFDYEVPSDGTIDRVGIFFAQGQQFDLRVNLMIIQSGSQVPDPIILYAEGTEPYIAGDNVYFERNVMRPVTPGDLIRVYAESHDAANDMNLSVDITIDYYIGKGRVL